MLKPINKKRQRKAQTVLEYTFLMGIIFAIVMAMSTMVKRTSQAMVKITADQIGAQQNAEQVGGKMGLVVNSTVRTEYTEGKTKREELGVLSYDIIRDQEIGTEVHTNLGFVERESY